MARKRKVQGVCGREGHHGHHHLIEVVEPAPEVVPDFTMKGFRERRQQRALELWRADRTIKEITKELGVSPMIVTWWIQEANGNLKRRVKARRRYENRTPEQIEEDRRRNRERYHAQRKKIRESMSRDTASE